MSFLEKTNLGVKKTKKIQSKSELMDSMISEILNYEDFHVILSYEGNKEGWDFLIVKDCFINVSMTIGLQNHISFEQKKFQRVYPVIVQNMASLLSKKEEKNIDEIQEKGMQRWSCSVIFADNFKDLLLILKKDRYVDFILKEDIDV